MRLTQPAIFTLVYDLQARLEPTEVEPLLSILQKTNNIEWKWLAMTNALAYNMNVLSYQTEALIITVIFTV